MHKYRNKDYFGDVEQKKENPVIPIVIFISVVIVLGIISTLIFNSVVKSLNVDLPWTEENEKVDNKKPNSSTRDEMKLRAPELKESLNTIDIDDATLIFRDAKVDSKGIVITVDLISGNKFTTIEAYEVLVDGFYTTTTFVISDKKDEGIQQPTSIKIRLNKSELDELEIFSFNEIFIYYNLENSSTKVKNSYVVVTCTNEISVKNKRKGLLQVDEVDNILFNYYKTIDANDATYVYFDIQNRNSQREFELTIKKLMVNNELYEIKDYKEKIYRKAQHSYYIKIPKSKYKMVSNIKVSFLVKEFDEDQKPINAYITKEYSKVY